MAEVNKPANTANTGDGEKKGVLGKVGKFVAGQLFDIQFTNPFTGAVHNLLNAIPNSSSVKNAIANFFKRGAISSKSFNHDYVLPISDVIDALATVLNTTFYGFDRVFNKMGNPWKKANDINHISSRMQDTKNGMSKVEFARMCKKCPVKMHNSKSRSNFKEAYWTILEPLGNNTVSKEFEKVFHTREKIMLVYWNDKIKGNAPKLKEAMQEMLGAWKVKDEFVVKSSTRPADGEEGSPRASKPRQNETEAEKKERERIERANALKRKKNLGITAGAGEFSWDPVIVEDFLQAKKLGIKWVVVLRDDEDSIYGDVVSEAEEDDDLSMNSDARILINRRLSKLVVVTGKTSAKKKDDMEKLKTSIQKDYERFAREQLQSIGEKIEKYEDKANALRAKKDKPDTDDEVKSDLEYKAKKADEAVRKLKKLSTMFHERELIDLGKELIVLPKNKIEEERDGFKKKADSLPVDDAIAGNDEAETKKNMDKLDMQFELANFILNTFNVIGKSSEELEAEKNKRKEKSSITKRLTEMNITKGILHAICDIRDMEKSLDDKELKDIRKLNDKLKNIKSADDFHLGLTYDPDKVNPSPETNQPASLPPVVGANPI